MNQIRQHMPSFFSGFDRKTAEFETIEELLKIPFVNNFAIADLGWPFCRFSYSADIHGLMAEYEDGRHWLVVGFIRDELPDGALPDWVPK